MTDRGFSVDEFRARVSRAQTLMAAADLSALLLTTEPEVRYYTGFLTSFWLSPTRPWYVVMPQAGTPIAIIPAIGERLMADTWVKDIRTWDAPDYDDDGIGLLAEALREVTPRGARIGVAHHMESHLRMPLADFDRLRDSLKQRQIVPDAAITRRLRMVKSAAERAKIQCACVLADHTFSRMAEIAGPGRPLDEVFRAFQRAALEEGADQIPYLAGSAGVGGYLDVISPATETPLAAGDVLMLDTGVMWDGYFCDFNRNFSLGAPPAEVADAHKRLIEATQVGFDAAQPGARISDIYHAMAACLRNPDGSVLPGRFGHGLGMQLTEWPSIIASEHCEIFEGTILTLEPSLSLAGGRLMVHEEDIAVARNGPVYLSTPQRPDITVIA
ncbi:MAG: Xaa-Pro peptidase family protein [Pseudomonadota bacterium]